MSSVVVNWSCLVAILVALDATSNLTKETSDIKFTIPALLLAIVLALSITSNFTKETSAIKFVIFTVFC